MNRIHKTLLFLALSFFNCGLAQQQTTLSPFEYREVYLPELPMNEGRSLNLNSLDTDWGIWGHNLSVVLPANPTPSVYARSGNSVNNTQFCFSSDALYRYIRTYIDDNFGNSTTVRFAILPNDNSTVCLCPQCVEHGNSPGNASGAVYFMLERLAQTYPKHIFFSSYYRTTATLPSKPLPENAGVLISAMDYPLSPVHTPKEDEFLALISQWKGLTSRLYIWDYINNFDDYLTPLPIFDIAQRRLRLYADAGVKGVFFNGSGTDYSTMSRLKTHILAAILSDPDVDWRPLLKEMSSRLYPVTGDIISSFIISQENYLTDRKKAIPMYEGVPVAVKTYLPADAFIRFHEELIDILPVIKDPEYTEIRTMTRAMMFTRLELKRIAADTVGTMRMLDALERSIPQGVVTYSESGGSTASYIGEYRYMLKHAQDLRGKDLLKGIHIEPLTALDEDYSDVSILTDGLLGLPSSYHCGQMLSSATPALRLAIPPVNGIKKLRISVTRNPIYHIEFPSSVSLSVNGRDLGRKIPNLIQDDPQHGMVEFDIPSDCKGAMVLTIVRNQDERTMAIDEIEGF